MVAAAKVGSGAGRGSARREVPLENRRQSYALAAKMMREILVDHLRRGRSLKHGGTHMEIAPNEAKAGVSPPRVDFLTLDDALGRPGPIEPRYVEIVELRYLAGQLEWGFAPAWLRCEPQWEAGAGRC